LQTENGSYLKNTLIVKSPVNKFFEEILWMSDAEFREWVIAMRKEVVHIWDVHEMPPRIGFTKEEAREQFLLLQTFPCREKFLTKDYITGDTNVIRNTSVLGNAINDWFPTMMKTKINYTKDESKGKSIYDYFANDDLLESFMTYASRHFKRDSFYHYSLAAYANDHENQQNQPVASTAVEWIEKFEKNYRGKNTHDYWLCVKDDEDEYTGYNEDIKARDYLYLTKAEVESLPIPYQCKVNLNGWKKASTCQIRVFEKNKHKIFPVGLKAFRISYCQVAVNFPPLTAKYIWDKYTDDFEKDKPIIVWDPSAGWGGRLLGALAVPTRKKLLYLANDPNTDHNVKDDGTKYHTVYKFFKNEVFARTVAAASGEIADFEFWQLGSEVMQFDPKFQQYKGKISVVFTSPPYFAKEAYSQDATQSYKKFSNYDIWKEGFLYETLKTAVEWLRPGGYIAWNIADAAFDGEMLHLEQDSIDILTKLGMEHKDTLKMTLAQMPGGNRIGDDGKPKAKNFVKIKNNRKFLFLKYEPIYIFQKAK
jgi:hypothetical protein